jgi:hypothetical protein
VVYDALHKEILASIIVLGTFLFADSSIPRAFDHSLMMIVGITLCVRLI